MFLISLCLSCVTFAGENEHKCMSASLSSLLSLPSLTRHNEEAFSYLEYPSSKSYEFCDDNKSNNIKLFFLNNNNFNKNKLLFLKTSLA
jgi:hypothetical protein